MCCAATRSNNEENSPKKGRVTRSPGSHNSSPVKSPALCGVGIVFQDKHKDGLYVSSLVKNGPAFHSEKVHVGDILVEVDGRDVEKFAVAELGPYLLGEAGSEVQLKFKRAGSLVSVTLSRGFAFTRSLEEKLSSAVDGRVVCGFTPKKSRSSAPHSPVSIASVN
eukprot:CAMPEP_0206268628 /NCGR_PEP_ID=MMETSP0047_2-20121206/31822_1 /ASSEMBLY_ACC=CAM_ASM_000192 /TAXON_ID=195065 /ORGANISM="Chroomonas mesostigmatica_cf, Strain CCMP1168" /LENGTH=164 /DNA_ID=CAMNT_0053696987 /DNA_START=156 /DNA_END=650 /DNA_ORIENTATION=-